MSSRRWGGVVLALGGGLVFTLPMTACEGEDVDIVIADFVPDSGTFETPDTSTTPPSDTGAAEPDTGTPDATVTPDADTALCDNGKIDPGETCDPLASCPTSCAPVGCQLRELQNEGTCAAACVDTKLQDACINGDGCCPPGCNANNDDDCAASCGNGVLEGDEVCDPLASCPKSCAPVGCQLKKLEGAGTCGAKCVDDKLQTACVSGDQCCPAGCNANNDSDCKPGCGNGILEQGELCDPLASCPQSCPQLGCQLRTLKDPGTCTAQCVNAGQQTACSNNDGCCPAGCNANNDNDCQPKCGNGVLEKGETCDPVASCPKCVSKYTCFAPKGSAATCDLVCNAQSLACGKDEGASAACCPFGKGGDCGAKQDPNCTGEGWKFLKWPQTVSTKKGCVKLALRNVVPGGSYELTTCGPSTETPGQGDTFISNVLEGNYSHDVSNDDCTDPNALPRLAGWSCKNNLGEKLSCASPSPGGFIVKEGPTISFEVCSTGVGAGETPVYVWYNAPKPPSPLQ